jgi:Mg-chelatase subunit ChlD
VRVEGDEGARLAFALLAVRPDTDEYGRKEADRLIRSVGQDFAAAVWTGSNQYDHIAFIVAGLEAPYGYTYTLGCTMPTVDIVHPTTSDRAHAGNPQNPERFLIWLNVAGDAPFATPSLPGLDWQRDFRVFVGPANVADNEVMILDGGYVMGQYWLVVKAPDKPGAAYGSIYDLTVRLGDDVDTTQDDAVVYDVVRTDRMLVIDRTGSMAGEKLVAAKAAARLHTEDLFQFDRLGVVSYAVRPPLPSASVNYTLTVLPDAAADNVRLGAQEGIRPLAANGETSIAAGLSLAQDQLDIVASDNEWWMVLLSDGRENHEPWYDDALQERLIAAGTKVHAIALGDDAQEDLMRSIATNTCGEDMLDACYHHIVEPGAAGNTPVRDNGFAAAAQPLINRLADLYTPIAEKIAGHDRLWENQGHIAGGSIVTQTISIQESGIKDAVFSFNWDQVGAATVVLRNPAGTEVIPGPGVVRLDDRRGPNHVVWQIANLAAGNWTATLSVPFTATNYIASLSGRQTDGTQLRVFLDRAVGDRWVGLPQPVVANLTDGRGRVLNAAVRAEISHPGGRLDTLDLFDDGAHGDGVAGDGTYGGHYTRVTQSGSYDIRIVASGTNNYGYRFTRYAYLSYLAATELTSADSDHDGLPNRWEVRFGLDPLNANGQDGAAGDPDQDNLPNLQEFLAGTNPIDADSDQGGESDGSEATHGRKPLDGRDDVVQPPREVWVEPGNGRNEIYFTPNATCVALDLERSTILSTTFAFLGTFPNTSPITDTNLVNGTPYYYRLRCEGGGGIRSPYTQIAYGQPKVDTTSPEGFVVINNGAEHTEALSVTLSLDAATDTTHVQISNRADFRNANWELYTYSRPWVLEPIAQTGEATVYVQFRDGSGNISPAEYDSIRYQPPQEVTILAASGGVLNSPEGRLRLVIPAGALPADAIFRYTRLERPSGAPARYSYAGAHFRLEARRVANGAPITHFNIPIQLYLNYQDYEWRNGPVTAETTLSLFRKTGENVWEPAAGTVDSAANRLSIALSNLSEFALFGKARTPLRIYLPLIIKWNA